MYFPTAQHFNHFLQLHEETVARRQPKFCDYDWESYFSAFAQQREGEYVIVGDRMLWRDGWQYSLMDVTGPEWPPPTDANELKQLKRKYWNTRRAMVTSELIALKSELQKLEQLQSTKSIPLKVFKQQPDPDTQQRPTVDIPIEGLKDRIAWLADDAIDCDNRLKELEGQA